MSSASDSTASKTEPVDQKAASCEPERGGERADSGLKARNHTTLLGWKA